jgi:hypothetical protein
LESPFDQELRRVLRFLSVPGVRGIRLVMLERDGDMLLELARG